MAKKINLKKLFSALDEELYLKLSSKIDEIYHPTAKGDEAELNWKGLLKTYLPERYSVDGGFVIDHKGNLSEQIDIIIYDRLFTPFIFRGENVAYIPAEGVYAVFEVKPEFNKKNFDYAVKKLKSVKSLQRTSATFTHILGKDKKELFGIIGGILTRENKGITKFKAITSHCELSVVLILKSGIKIMSGGSIQARDKKPILAFFLLKLIECLRSMGSVPALEVNKYLESLGGRTTKV